MSGRPFPSRRKIRALEESDLKEIIFSAVRESGNKAIAVGTANSFNYQQLLKCGREVRLCIAVAGSDSPVILSTLVRPKVVVGS